MYNPNFYYQQQRQPMNQFPQYHPMPAGQQMPLERQQLLMEDAIQIARQNVPGLVVEAELEQEHGRQIFEIDIVTSDGVRYEVEVDANSGEVIEISVD
ncbi:MAG TPA: PepSY domain-containing protein [Bacillota bacterium]|nr:PepSY domain-containing protein [Bacillota bacterium]